MAAPEKGHTAAEHFHVEPKNIFQNRPLWPTGKKMVDRGYGGMGVQRAGRHAFCTGGAEAEAVRPIKMPYDTKFFFFSKRLSWSPDFLGLVKGGIIP